MSVLRTMTWASMSESQRADLCARGIADIFDPSLREAISSLIDDVKANGDDAVCRALVKFDGVTLRPDQLTISPDAIASASVEPELEVALAALRKAVWREAEGNALAARADATVEDFADFAAVREQIKLAA